MERGGGRAPEMDTEDGQGVLHRMSAEGDSEACVPSFPSMTMAAWARKSRPDKEALNDAPKLVACPKIYLG